jgi:hypothetical protein
MTTRNMPTHRTLSTALLALSLAGCASMPPQACEGAGQQRVDDTLYFGTAKPAGVVTPQEWAAFLRDTVTPRFPQGLSVWEAAGQWRGDDGQIVSEASHVLNLVHPDDAASEKAVGEIVEAYKSRFEQEAVLRVRSQACATY